MDSAATAFAALLDAHIGIVYRVVRTYCWTKADQQDLAQEIQLQLWRAFPRYEATRSFSTWMYRIALNTAISWVRYQSVRRRHAAVGAVPDVAAESALPDATDALYQLIGQLEPFNRALVLLHLDGLRHEEIAEVLGISAGNVATKLHRLTQRLRTAAQQGTT